MADFLFGTKSLPTVDSSSASATFGPAWYQKYLAQLGGKASAIAGEPYQPYTQPRIAGFTEDQTAAFDRIRQGIGSFQPMLDTAGGMLTQAGGGFNQGEFDTLMNPYIDQVVGTIAQRGARNLTENLLPGVNTTFTGAGQFGGSRHAEFTNRALRDSQEAILAEQGRAMASGFSDQMKAYNDMQNRRISAGQGIGNLAQLGQGIDLRDNAALEAIGQTQQQQNQQNLNLGYSDFLEQRNYPRENIAFLNSALRGLPMSGQTTTSTSTGPGNVSNFAPSPLSQIAGAGVGVFGLGKSLGLFAEGGAVKRPAARSNIVPMRRPATKAPARGIGQFATRRAA
jgi:hypothetical protein